MIQDSMLSSMRMKHGNLGSKSLKSMKDKKTKVIDATMGMVLLPGLEENMNTKGAKNTIMNMILTLALSTSCHEDGRVDS